MDPKRTHHYTRMCALSAHDKCLGVYESPGSGQVPCDCTCHATLPTLWTEPDDQEVSSDDRA